ncbi:hypothetical protein K7567_12475 [Stenotrophomonas maltophilia]|nr:hypothetical protein K7567_12475 [Stenotrophomonas maltophilia]
MKTSPLQLKWVTYPEASYEANTDFDGDESLAIDVEVDAEVRYSLDGRHSAFVTIKSLDETSSAYKFKVVVIAGFEFDLEIAREAYKPKASSSLPTTIAVNVARVLYSSAREQIAMMTSRAPYSSVVLKSVLLEPRDVTIRSPDAAPPDVLREIFGATDEEVEQFIERRVEKQKGRQSTAKKRIES